ncbi:Holliday junction resolvase RuvX [Chlamydia buteonis]|uniref:Putative pre-16S rRNA nuclease n=1 Tax=Chlamydia buteonis TaxID=2494525 RepID=A0ABX8L9M8_9CHLA|nr:Holliday junction resolvase RuvX [Chlamydia buteonis]QXE27023.1 Holliday junction resolvase RuvX [Chlamydia buteonis]QXE28038.1 Holliday junction resolvase RuvX [Chlamydia buteonis]
MSNPQVAKVFLGVDYGERRIGLAYAAYPLCISLPIGFIETGKTLGDTAKLLVRIIHERNVSTVVLGNPIPMQKRHTSVLQEDIIKLASLIQESCPVEVILWDERLSSAQAERMLKGDCGLSRKKRKGKTDSIAATLILTSFLESSPHTLS